jgi:hypothetical protein
MHYFFKIQISRYIPISQALAFVEYDHITLVGVGLASSVPPLPYHILLPRFLFGSFLYDNIYRSMCILFVECVIVLVFSRPAFFI